MSKIVVCLARNGDLLNLFPLFKAESDAGQPVSCMVARPYLSVFDGISYASPVVFDGDISELDRAVATAKSMSTNVQCLQCIGQTDAVKRLTYGPAGQDAAMTDSFQKEPYRLAKRMDLWAKQPVLEFDKRSPEREKKFHVEHWPSKGKKVILVSLGGTSSPFAYKNTLMRMLTSEFKKGYAILDISTLKAQYLFDLLGLYESAHCLVASDSAPLHLAQACPNLPVVALTNDSPTPWFGSAIRANHIAYCRYGDFAKRAPELIDAIKAIAPKPNPDGPLFIHAWSQYELNEENQSRFEAAKETWSAFSKPIPPIFGWVEKPVPIGALGRDSAIVAKDKLFRVPFVKDVIRVASLAARDDEDMILLTRCDTCVEYLDFAKGQPFYAHRTLRNGHGDTFHPVCDFFAFTIAWWKAHQEELPEMFLGMDPYWPNVFMALVRKHGGKELKDAIYREPGVVPKIEGVVPHVAWNEKAHSKWVEKNGPINLHPPVSEQIETIVVNRHALFTHGYNPSILRFKDRLLMAYRYHNQRDLATALAIAEIDETGAVKSNKVLNVPHQGGSEEDAQLFVFKGELHVAYVDSIWPQYPPKCVVKFGKLTEAKESWEVKNMVQPKYGQNDMTGMEKNWRFFQGPPNGNCAEPLLCIYSSSPDQIIISWEGLGYKTHKSDAVRWKWGDPKGGCAPMPYGDNWLRFFHSTLDNEIPPNRRRYYLGAMLMEPEPPFKVLKISQEPIAYGSETDTLSPMERSGIPQYKPKVIFPLGCVAMKDHWLVSVGLQDCICALLKVREGDLKL